VTRWDDEGAHVRSALDGAERVIPADTLVLATTNTPETAVTEDLSAAGYPGAVQIVGDALAARSAVQAIFEGRVAGLRVTLVSSGAARTSVDR
jgi:hypothetical protein